MRKWIPGAAVVAAAAAFSVWAYPRLPEQVATHFNMQGVADDWSSRLFAALLGPVMLGVLVVVLSLLPRIDPRRANYALFGSTYWTIATGVLVLVAGIHVLTLGQALGWNVNMNRVVPLAVGAMIVLLGNVMTRIRPNWFMGIRTPWTLSSDSVWRKTHRFAGVAFVIAGVCVAASSVIDSRWGLISAMGVAAFAALSSVIYSYIAWKQEQTEAVTSR